MIQDRIDVANLLNKNFQSFFVIEDEGILPSYEVMENLKDFIDLQPEDISFDHISINFFRKNKAIEPDKLHAKSLKTVQRLS